MSKVVEALRADAGYLQALSRARSDEERQRIAAFVEAFVTGLSAAVERLQGQLSDPADAERLRKALDERQRVVTADGSKH